VTNSAGEWIFFSNIYAYPAKVKHHVLKYLKLPWRRNIR